MPYFPLDDSARQAHRFIAPLLLSLSLSLSPVCACGVDNSATNVHRLDNGTYCRLPCTLSFERTSAVDTRLGRRQAECTQIIGSETRARTSVAACMQLATAIDRVARPFVSSSSRECTQQHANTIARLRNGHSCHCRRFHFPKRSRNELVDCPRPGNGLHTRECALAVRYML